MKRNSFLIISLYSISIWSGLCAQTVQISNKSDKPVKDYTVEIPIENLKLNIGDYIAVDGSNTSLPVEIVTDLKGNQKAIFPVSLLQGKESQSFGIRKGTAHAYPKRTYAELAHKIGGKFEPKVTEKYTRNEYVGGYSWVKPNYLRVPDNFTDHAYYIKYEGPGWESDKVGFRFYLDWRNGIDVFGKKTPGIVLPFVGVDGYDNYHNMADWGMDNMKVGSSLGIGSIAIWNGEKAVRVEKTDSTICHIPADGKVRSQVKTTYYGWDANGTKCNLTSLISIDAGSRASHMELLVDKKIDNLATGIIKMKNTELIVSNDSGNEWSYVATFGKQSLNNDMMGLAVFVRTKQVEKITEDKLNHVVVLKPDNGYVEYYFMPTWELDWEPVATIDDFKRCIDEVLVRLNNPVTVKIK
ncbi:DUF4861 domain-containing protein [Dysgonomonas sp. 520]|uniref:DUF4861 domain-containing protein n=1 Tax=Dysgonomonas sp. 520 TaxID=2302931 RepID=UPI0013CFF016|nr:DUF4861 domain-containing protein [Dysgonomonas sp. 520]